MGIEFTIWIIFIVSPLGDAGLASTEIADVPAAAASDQASAGEPRDPDDSLGEDEPQYAMLAPEVVTLSDQPLACVPTVGPDLEVRLRGRPIGLRLPESSGARHRQVAAWPLDADAILVAIRWNWPEGEYDRPTPDGRLWRLGCDGRLETYFESPDADFGNAALSPGGVLFFSGAAGVEALDLPSRRHWRVTEERWIDCSNGWKTPGRDIVTGWTADGRSLAASWGTYCSGGCHAWWSSRTLHIPRADALSGKVYIPPIISTASSDAGGAIWVATEPACGEACPGPPDPIRLWRSKNSGRRWKTVSVRVDGQPVVGLVDRLLPDQEIQGRLIVVEWVDVLASPEPPPARAWITQDGGRRWRLIDRPAEAEGRHGRLELDRGSTRRLLFEGYIGRRTVVWRSSNSGKTWRQMASAERPVHTVSPLRLKGQPLQMTANGVWRGVPATPGARRLFPPR